MRVDVDDPGVAAAVRTALNHPGPFSVEECAGFDGALSISHASDLRALVAFPRLRSLELVASEVADLAAVSSCGNLERLRVVACPLRSVAWLSELRRLSAVDLLMTYVEDLSPLRSLPRLVAGSFIGNPLDERSYLEHRVALLTDNARPPRRALDFPPPSEWSVERAIFQRGYHACFGCIDVRGVLARPGRPLMTRRPVDAVEFDEWSARAQLLERGLPLSEIFGRVREADGGFDFRCNHEYGNADLARDWVLASSLPAEDKHPLMRFIGRFPGLVFYREREASFRWEEAHKGIRLPAWWRELRAALAFVYPHSPVSVRLERFDRPSITSDRLGQVFYSFGLLGFPNIEQRGLVDGGRVLYPVADWLAGESSTLAINLADPEDQRVYEYAASSVSSGGSLPPGASRVVFERYADLVGRVVEVAPEGDAPVVAQA